MRQEKQTAWSLAFHATVPIFAGFLFLGITYGIYMHSNGFNFLFSLLMSATIFSGSMEFVTVSLLVQSFNPVFAFLMTLLINFRHIFYGLSMLSRYRGAGIKKLYLIFGLCDQTFLINYTTKIPHSINKTTFMTYTTFLTHLYWMIGATSGGILSTFITIKLQGLNFVMTALFIVLFVSQIITEDRHLSSTSGVVLALLTLIFFGKQLFLLVTLVLLLIEFAILYKKGVFSHDLS